jgi:hypothetical protein
MAKKETTGSTGSIVNPFEAGVSYDNLLAAIPEGQSVAEYLSPLGLEKHQVEWIEIELKAHVSHQKNKEANLAKANAEHTALVNSNK